MTNLIDTAPAPVPTGPPPQVVRKSYQSAKDGRRDAKMIVDINGTEFTTWPGRAPGTVQIDFSGLTVTRDPEAMWAYFRSTLGSQDEFEKFQAFLNDEANDVDINMLVEIIKDMMEFANGLPTAQSSS